MPRKRKPSTPTFRRPLPFVSSPLQASPRNPPSPLKPNISPPEARSVPFDCLSDTDRIILPCSQLTSSSSSSYSSRSKRKSPRLLTTASSRVRRGGGGGGRGRKKTPPKPTNKAPVVTLVRDGAVDSRPVDNRRRTRTTSNDRVNRVKQPALKTDHQAQNQSDISPEILVKVKRKSSVLGDHHPSEKHYQQDVDKNDENFLHSKNLLKTPPARKSRRKTQSSPSSPQLPLANVINTPILVHDRHTVSGEADFLEVDAADEDLVIPDTCPVAEDVDAADAEATFLTPQRKVPQSQVLAPETPAAEMGLTYVEKSAMARRRLREIRQESAR